MASEKPSGSLPPSSAIGQQIFEPLSHLIRYRGHSLKSKRWTNIMQILWDGDQKPNTVRNSLCDLPIHKLDAIFLDGTPIKIQYVFDPTRRNRDYVFVKLDCLLPLFGGEVPSTIDGFSSIMELCCFVQKKVNFNECENYRYASCPCHQLREGEELPEVVVRPSVDICKHQHFHHFCWKHVVSWLYNYLTLMILLQESKQHFDEEIAYQYSTYPADVIVHFQTGKRIAPEFLFKTALYIDKAIYISDDEQ